MFAINMNDHNYCNQENLVERINCLKKEKVKAETVLHLLNDSMYLNDADEIINELHDVTEKIDNEIKTTFKKEIDDLQAKKHDIEACLDLMEHGPNYHGADVNITELFFRNAEIEKEMKEVKDLADFELN